MDLDNDGYTDILSGKYNPNDVTWFRGSKDGFFEGVILKEEREKLAKGERRLDELMKTLKCSPVFVDIDGDKDLDMFVTGFNKVRLNINVGTPEYPKFGKREYVSTVSGKLVESSHSTLAVVDWDGDNILDLVLTDGYYNKGDVGLKYYKGLGKGKYADAKPIFKNKDGIKYISGRSYWICSTDWNNDGKTDFLIGSCITTKDGKILKDLNNKVEVRKKRTKEEKAQYMKEKAKLLEGTKGYGYVYLLLRKK